MPKATFACHLCSKQYGRQDHLKRHTATHTDQRLFSCDRCDKQFDRRDALHRHQYLHRDRPESLLLKGQRACSACVVAKTRCSGTTPCQRCETRSIACQYLVRQSAEQSDERRSVSGQDPDKQTQQVAAQHSRSEGVLNQSEQSSLVSLEQGSGDQIRTNQAFNKEATYSRNIVTDHRGEPSDLSNARALYSVGNDILSHNQVSDLSTRSSRLSEGYQPAPYSIAWNASDAPTINWLEEAILDGSFETTDGLESHNHFFESPFPDIPYSPPALPRPTMSAATQPFDINSPQTQHHSPASSERDRVHGEVQERSVESSTGSGVYYVDSSLARLPKGQTRKPRVSRPFTSTGSAPFSLAELSPSSPVPISEQPVSERSYDMLRLAFATTCAPSGGVFKPFVSDSFPRLQYFRFLIHLYIKNFQPTLPLLHVPSLVQGGASWTLLLAVAAIGSHYIEDEGCEAFSISMHEFMRRCLFTMDEDAECLPWVSHDRTTSTVVVFLHTIGTTYSGDDRLSKHGFSYQQALMDFCENEWTSIPRVANHLEDDIQGRSVEQDWLSWRDGELALRLGYSIWFLDCLWAIHYHRKPFLTLDQARMRLPCHEILWDCSDAVEWRGVIEKLTGTQSLLQTIQRLYVEKDLSPALGDFSRTLLIHGLFRRSWEVEIYFSQGLSAWNPTAKRQSTAELKIPSSIWLPAVPEFVKWRNSACDCLDVLHWSANATIGNAGGNEHPTVLHLHLARVILLTPFREIMNLAHFAVAPSSTSHPTMIQESEQAVRKWAMQDQYKARLAMVHAGVLFWHVRRFSRNTFYEPCSVALAALALWAFITFGGAPSPPPQALQDLSSSSAGGTDMPEALRVGGQIQSRISPRSPHDEEQEEPSACDIILLDRPTDDELVQQFVRRGDNMVAHMSGVGNLYGERGAERVLIQGVRLLSTISGWGTARPWIEKLQALAVMTRQRLDGNAGGF